MARVAALVVAVAFAAWLAACGKESPGDSPTSAAGALQGTWKVTLTRGTTSCSAAPGTVRYGLAVIGHSAGSGQFTVTTLTLAGHVVTGLGTFSGSAVTLSLPALDPTFTALCPIGLATVVALTLDAPATRASGTSTWTCTHFAGTCTGTDAVVADRL